MDPDQFLADFYQLKDTLAKIDEIVSEERLTTTVIVDQLPSETYSWFKQQVIRNPDPTIFDVERMMRSTHINHVEKSSVTRESGPKRR